MKLGMFGPDVSRFGDISMPSTGCTLDGVFILCDMADRLLESDAAVVGPANTTRYNYTKQRFEFFRAELSLKVGDEGMKQVAYS